MTVSVFLDTNVLVYAALGTGKDERKRKRALELIESEGLWHIDKEAVNPALRRPGPEWIRTRLFRERRERRLGTRRER